jgi:type II secretion system protein D
MTLDRIRWKPWIAAGAVVILTCAGPGIAQDQPVEREDAPAPEPVAAPIEQMADVQNILKSLDPEMLNALIGAEVEVEMVGDQMILQGPDEAVATLELLIRLLDESREGERKQLEIVVVEKRDANEIARTLEPAMREVLFEPNQRPEDEVTITALSPSVILVGALPKHIDFVIEVIHQVDDQEEGIADFERLVFPIKHRKAADVAKQLTEIVQKINARRGQTGAQAEIQVIPNNANNSIIVIAPEEERPRFQQLIDELDVEPVKGWGEVKLTLFPLLHSKANDLADTINELLASQQQREAAEEVIQRLSISKALPSGEIIDLPPIDLQRPTRIIPDDGTNSLIIATVEENVGPMGELIRMLDGVPTSDEIGIRIFPLRFADSDSVAETLNEMFDDGKTLPEDPDGSGQDAVPAGALGKIVYNIGVSSDVRTNTVIVTGRQEQLLLVEMIVGELDRPATAYKFPLRLLQLQFTDASRVGEIITELMTQRFEAAQATGANQASLERERVFLSVDIRSNSLILSASEENFAEIESIVRQLDTMPAKLFDQIRIVRCHRTSAVDLKTKIEELWQRKADLRRQQELTEDLPVVVVDERSNSLIVASSVEDFEEIERLVATLESQPLIEDVRLFALSFADATVLAGMLDELFEGMAGQSESFKAPTILPDPRSNALVAAGSRDALERVGDVVNRLDVESGPLTATLRVYPLQHASAANLAQRMQELFDNRTAGQDSAKTPIVILAEESSNAVVVSASRDDHAVVVDLLGLLDKPSSLARQFEIFPLKLAKAAAVAEKLETLFQSKAEGQSGRADAIATAADERTNSIIVWASPGQMVNIKDVVRRLDTATPAVEMMIKVIQLRQALAEDFAKLLDEVLIGEGGGGDDERAVIVSFLEKDDRGQEIMRKLLRQDIKIQADPRTNSLMVLAPADSMNMLEAMINDFDRIRPVTSEIRLFPLVNSDAQSMVDQLTELFQADGGGGAEGEAPAQIVFGAVGEDIDLAQVGQELRFAADRRTNTLLVAGSKVYLNMIEDLVTYLDSQEAEDRVSQVVHAKFRSATDLANAVKSFNDQELNVLGAAEDEESQTRRMDRQISVEAIGDEESGSSSLMLGTSRRAYARTMQMIEDLDRPEPQVMISVLIAEVTLSDDAELGVEIAGQDLTFSKSAIMGPNGIIEGSDFDFVGGTNLGALGSGLGFNFTITGEDFSFLFHALQQNSRLEVLSRPILLVRNGEEGNITIADQIPIVTATNVTEQGNIVPSFGREDVGIILTATPHISPDGYVTIELSQEISNISGENIPLTEGVSQPVFSTRSVDTNVTVRDGETVIIGGLIQTRKSEGEAKVPIVGDLPLLGWLFRTTNSSDSRTELMVVLTVDVVRTDEEVREMARRQRDQYALPPSILQSPYMGALRIAPEQTGLGPKVPTGARPEGTVPQQREQYGPKPKTYGPALPTPTPTSASTARAEAAPARSVYGPRVARNEEAEPQPD